MLRGDRKKIFKEKYEKEEAERIETQKKEAGINI
jgi:hypothetical protein